MSREWYAVFGRLNRLPKFRRLSESAQLTLAVYVWGLAGDQVPEATWVSLDALAEQLALVGRARADVDELLAANWLEVTPGGGIGIHDWDAHQYAATAEIRRAYEADRKADWRLRKRADPSDVRDGSGTGPGHVPATGQNITGDNIGERGEDGPPRQSLNGHDEEFDRAVGVLTDRGFSRPIGWAATQLGDLVHGHGGDVVVATLTADTVSRTTDDFVRATALALRAGSSDTRAGGEYRPPMAEVLNAFEIGCLVCGDLFPFAPAGGEPGRQPIVAIIEGRRGDVHVDCLPPKAAAS